MQTNRATRPRRRPGVTSARIAARRALILERIVATAGDLMSRRGTAAVSVEQVLLTAGVSRGTFYSYFANRSELIAAVIAPALRTGIEQLARLEHERIDRALIGIVELYLDLWRRHRAALTITPEVDADSFARIRRLHDAFVAGLRRILERAAGAGQLRAADAALTLEVLTRTAIPLVRIYSRHPQGNQLYREAMLALILSPRR